MISFLSFRYLTALALGLFLSLSAYAGPVISEFMASNSETLADEDGDFPDWIEIYNPDMTAVNLSGWHLTDDASDLSQWTFPAVTLAPKERLIVFASGKNRVNPASELHTNFSLSSGGEYLGLVEPDASTISSEFAPAYPPQVADISYGSSDPSTTITLCGSGSDVMVRIPTSAVGNDTTWRNQNFNSSTTPSNAPWLSGTLGVGYETDTDPDNPFSFTPAIAFDVSAMRNNTRSCQIRVPIPNDLPNLADILSLSLTMNYDDGFFLFLNGQNVGGINTPASGNLNWNSGATAGASDETALNGQTFDITNRINLLQAGTGNLLAIHGLNASIGSSDFLQVATLRATIVDPAGISELGFFSVPTPGQVNGSETFSGFLDDTNFAVGRGFYSIPFNEIITTDEPGTTIVYTTDGSVPTLSNGTQVSAPDTTTPPTAVVPINSTSVLRAVAFKDGFAPTNTDTQTYVFSADVASQTVGATLAKGFPSSWNGTSPDYGMDPDVVGPNDLFGGQYTASIASDLEAIPSVSVVMPIGDLFGANGIYSNPTQQGMAWERATSVEFINPDGSEGFQIDCGIRIQGNASRSNNLSLKNSFRLAFRRQYGAGTLEHDLYGDGAADEFNTLMLRMHFNDGWSWGGAGGTPQFAREQYGHDLQIAAGSPSSHGRLTHLYLNGVYWGLYNLRERPDARFAASTFDIDDEEWDGLNTGNPVNSSDDPDRAARAFAAWDELVSRAQLVTNAGSRAARHDEYMDVMGLNTDGSNDPTSENFLDVDNYIDYLLINFHMVNADWPGRNFYCGRHNSPDSEGFKFFVWDPELSVNLSQGGPDERDSAVDDNRIEAESGAPNSDRTVVTVPFHRLRPSEAFRIRFADRAHRMLFNGGVLYVDPDNPSWDPANPERNRPAALYSSIVDRVESPAVAESARWGDQHTSTPLTVAEEWVAQRDLILNTWLPARSAIFLQQLKDADLYPDTDAPAFNQHGGTIPSGFPLTITAGENDSQAGTIYFTTDGVDPLQINSDGTFSVSSSAQVYTRGGPSVPINSSVTVMARTLNSQEWSALNTADFVTGTTPSSSSLVISEFSYRPNDPSAAEIAAGFDDQDDFEFIELLNISNDSLDLSTLEFNLGVTFDFSTISDPADRTLAPGERVLLVEDADAFAMRHGTPARVIGQWTGALDNSSETLRLQIRGGAMIQEFTYDDGVPWPECADGDGYSLTLIAPDTAPNHDDPFSWRCSIQLDGSPGASDAVPFVGNALDDLDGDQLAALIEYALGSSDGDERSGRDRYQVSTVEVIEGEDAGIYPSLTYTRNLAADDVSIQAEHSTNLETWENVSDGAVLLVSEVPNGDGTSTVTWRSTTLLNAVPNQFLRLAVELR